jgi:methylmalonyl-CoA mutase
LAWSIETAISSISFSIAIDTDFFVSIAKLKALRYLWFQIAQAYGYTAFKAENFSIHARSEVWINPDFQPHGNMLKETTAAMATVLGGANRLSTYPEDIENEVMSRIARNTTHILREESHFNKVADPLAGAYLVENMVTEMAEKAWAKFQSHCK